MSKTEKNIHLDIQKIINDWKLLCKDHSLIKKSTFLKRMQGQILNLNRHSTYLKKDKELLGLIKHILHTPPGAPFVFEKSLYESAKAFKSSHAKGSLLQQYLVKSINSSKGKNNFLFLSLDLIDDEIKKVA